MPTPLLPTELIHQILRYAYYNASGSPDRHTISTCALVCLSWTEEAQRLLFLSVGLPRKEFLSDIPAERASRIGTFVRRLNINVRSHGNVQLNGFIELLGKCPNLYELVLAIEVHELDAKTMDNLAHPPSPTRIVALNLRSCGTQSPILFQLLSLWPSIEFLRLGTEIAARHPPTPPTFKLYELTLLRNLRIATLEWLLSASEGHLRILEFRDPPGREIDPIFNIHGPHLQSLRLFRHSGHANSMVQKCVGLKELVLFQISHLFRLDNLPKSLEHFGFRNFIWGEIRSYAPVIRVIEQLPNLKLVTCDEHTRKHQDFPKLAETCEERGIELSTEAPPSLVVSAWVVSPSFD